MRKTLQTLLLTMLIMLPCLIVNAEDIYPETMDTGNYILVDGGMGEGIYADKSSVSVQTYDPPNYQIAINVVFVDFSDDFWRQHQTYIGGPYKIKGPSTLYFRYNWDRKSVSYLTRNGWMDWNINRDYCHADGNPLIPLCAEVAFVSAYNMRFYNDTMGYSPLLKRQRRVIEESFYRTLGI
ncbi:hypothetical protein [Selenomonas noxia]|uniref:hypothetical protein n=1 Tax=Selenomonas noxia TaxID=135083 RepID=UPI0028D6D0E7|nr:hypothetical protein [Selenomonas noxia]